MEKTPVYALTVTTPYNATPTPTVAYSFPSPHPTPKSARVKTLPRSNNTTLINKKVFTVIEVIMEIIEGQVYPTRLRQIGNSAYVLITPELLDYLELKPEEVIVIKAEKSKKWGHYIGIGKDKR